MKSNVYFLCVIFIILTFIYIPFNEIIRFDLNSPEILYAKSNVNETDLLKQSQKAIHYYNNAVGYLNNKKYKKADREIQKAIDIYRSNTDINPVSFIRSLILLGKCQYMLNKYSQAIINFEEAKDSLLSRDNDELLTDCLFMIGNAYYFSHSFNSASDSFQEALEKYETSNNSFKIAESRYCLGLCAYNLNEFIRAIDHFRIAENIFNQFDKRKDIDCKYYIALSRMQIKNYEDSIADFIAFIDSFQSECDSLKLANSYYNSAICYMNIKDYHSAIKNFKSALIIYRIKNDSLIVANCYMGIGECCTNNQNWEEASKNLKCAMDIFIDDSLAVQCLKSLGQVYFNDKKYKAAIVTFLHGIKLCNNFKKFILKANMHFHLANVFEKTDTLSAAIMHYDTSGVIYLQFNKKIDAAKSLHNKGVCLLNTQNYTSAAREFLHSADLYSEEQENFNGAKAYQNAGMCFNYAGQYQDAILSNKKAKRKYKLLKKVREVADCDKKIASIYFNMEKYIESSEGYLEAVEAFLLIGDSTMAANCYQHAGHCFYNRNDPDKALDYYWKAKYIYDSLKEYCNEAELFIDIGRTCLTLGMNDEAILSYKQSLSLCSKLTIQADGYYGLGNCIINQRPPDILKARDAFFKAKGIYNKLYDLLSEAKCIERLGDTYRFEDNLDIAMQFYRDAESLYIKIKKPERVANCVKKQGHSFYNLLNFGEAKDYYLRALNIYNSISDHDGINKCKIHIGKCLIQLYETDGARQYFTEASEYFKKEQQKKELAECLIGFGDIDFEEYSFDLSLAQYELAWEHAKQLPDLQFQAKIHKKIAKVYEKDNQPNNAKSYIQKAKDCYNAIHDIEGQIDCELFLGSIYSNEGKFQHSIVHYQEALKLVDSIENKKYKNNILTLIGYTLFEIGSLDSSLFVFQKVKNATVFSKDSINYATSLNGIANWHYEKKKYDSAMVYYKKSLKLLKGLKDSLNIGKCYLNIGNVFRHVDLLDSAYYYYKQAKSLYNKYQYDLGIGMVLNNMGTVSISKENYEIALDLFQEAQHIFEDSYVKKFLITVYSNIGVCNENMYKYEEAFSYYRNAIQIAEESRTYFTEEKLLISYIESQNDLYDKIISLLFEKLKKPNKALSYLERSRSKNLLKEYKQQLTSNDSLIIEELNRLERKIQEKNELAFKLNQEKGKSQSERNSKRISRYSRKIIDIEDEIQQIEKELQKDPNYPGKVSLRLINLGPLRNCITENTALIWYYPLNDKLIIYVLTKTSQNISYVKITRDSLDSLIDQCHEFMNRSIKYTNDNGILPTFETWKDDNINELIMVTNQLYDCFINPIESELENIDFLVFFPVLQLHYLPYCLLSRKGENSDPIFAIERWKMTIYNRSMLITDYSKLQSGHYDNLGRDIAFFGLNGLKNTVEYKQLIRQYSDNKPLIFTQDNISTKNDVVEITKLCQILILYTHSKADSNYPDSSYILLDSSEKNGKKWYAFEIRRNQFYNLNLVILQSCETSMGEKYPGEEVSNLIHAFLCRGASSGLATLWPVHDNATYELMRLFYKHFLYKKIDKFESLQQAQISLIRDPDYKHPLCWAAFQLYGYWK